MTLPAKEAKHKIIHTMGLDIDEVQELTELINGDRSGNGIYHFWGGRGMTGKGLNVNLLGVLEMFYILILVVIT